MSRSKAPESVAERESIHVSNVFKGEALLEETDSELVCANGTLRYHGPDESVTVSHGTVVETRVDLDASVSGFRMIAGVFVVVALLMGYIFTKFVLISGGELLSVVGLGSGLSTVLSAASAAWMYRVDVGERVVLQLDCEDGERIRFITTADTNAFAEIEKRINDTAR